MAKKTTCPISREDFQRKAKTIQVTIGGSSQEAMVKQFATGSFGWYLNGRTTIDVDGTAVPVLINASFIVIGSKDLPSTPSAAASEPAAQSPAPPGSDAAGGDE
jgi:hypothetical protein